MSQHNDVFSVVFAPDEAWLTAALAAVKEGKHVSMGVVLFDAGDNCRYRTASTMDPLPLDRITVSTEYKPTSISEQK